MTEPTNEYPELEGTNNLCNDIVSQRSVEEEIQYEAGKYLIESNRQAFLYAIEWYRERTQSPPANESVPAPGAPEAELRRVRKAKEQHVNRGNWELAAAYREIEKLLQAAQPHCANCKFMLSAIGVGQGLICDLNKCRIPHSQHSCDHHTYAPSDKTCK